MSANQTEAKVSRKPRAAARESWTPEHDVLSAVVLFIWFIGLVQFAHHLI